MKDPKHEKLTTLLEQCRAQTDLYVRRETYDPQYCYEIWRRAIVDRDEAAWEATISQYNVFVRRWVSQRLTQFPALRFEEDALVNGVFINFFRFVKAEKFENFNNLAAILQYLKMCCGTIVADAVRDFQARNFDTSLDSDLNQDDSSEAGLKHSERLSSNFDLETFALDRADRKAFWEAVWRKLPDSSDKLLVYLRYILDMPPREIAQLHPQHFPDVNAVYRRNKNLLWRLRNSPDF